MKVETERLLDKAEHAIRAAEILLDADEGDFAAGRAYYAMFYVAEALLVERGRRFRKHSAIHAAFSESSSRRPGCWNRSIIAGGWTPSTGGL
jgi:uncharacterized protein (UPF0332 family)